MDEINMINQDKTELHPSWLGNVKNHPVVKTMTIYLVVAWIALQVSDILFPIFHLTNFHHQWLLLIMLTIFPLVVTFRWWKIKDSKSTNHQKKFLLPIGALLLSIAGVFYGSTLIGAPMTTIVAFEDETGKKEYVEQYKEKYRKTLSLFVHENKSNDTSLDWIGRWIMDGIRTDFQELSYIDGYPVWEHLALIESQKEAQSTQSEFFVTGDFDSQGDSLLITSKIYQTENLQILASTEEIIYSSDLTKYLDQLSFWIRQEIGISEKVINSETDYPISEMTTEIDSAAKYYTTGNFAQALKFDSTFCLAAVAQASNYYTYQRGDKATQEMITLAMRHKGRLGRINQRNLLLKYYQINGNTEAMQRIVEQQLQNEPDNVNLKVELFTLYALQNKPGAIEVFKEIRAAIPVPFNVYAEYSLFTNDRQVREQLIALWKEDYPDPVQHHIWDGQFALIDQDYDKALESFENHQIHFPDDPWVSYFKQSTRYYAEKNQNTIQQLIKKFAGSYQYSETNLLINFQPKSNFLIAKPKNQYGFSMMLLNDSTFISNTLNNIIQYTFLFNKADDPIMAEARQINNINKYGQKNSSQISLEDTYPNVLYKITDEIDSARAEMNNGNYSLARELFNQSQEEFPSHYFLKDYQEHIDFMTSETFANDRLMINDLIGRYKSLDGDDDRIISLENGQLYYKRLGSNRSTGALVLPLSKSFFKPQQGENFVLEIIRDGARIAGLHGWYFNHESRQYEKGDSLVDYTPKIKINAL